MGLRLHDGNHDSCLLIFQPLSDFLPLNGAELCDLHSIEEVMVPDV